MTEPRKTTVGLVPRSLPTSSSKRGLTALFVLVALATGLLSGAAVAVAGPTIQGFVTNNSAPLNRIVVGAFDASTHSYVKAVFTDSAGFYQISDLPAGSYHIRFSGTAPVSLEQWWNHVTAMTDASTATVGEGQTITVSSDLAPVAPPSTQGIQGTVTSGGTPLNRIVVGAYGATTHTLVKSAFTNSSGFYQITGLPTGSYHIRFTGTTPATLEQYWDHKAPITTANTATVVAAQLLTVSSALTPFAPVSTPSVEGTVTYLGAPQNRIVASVFDATTHDYVAGAFTNAAGYYKITNLPIGYYHVRFTGTTPSYLAQFWDHQLMGLQFISQATTTPLVGNAQTRQVSTDLAPVLWIVGDLTNNGVPVYRATASAYNLTTHSFVQSVYSDSSGHYVLKNLTPGSYQLRFTPDVNFPGSFPTQFWLRKSNASAATTITCEPVDGTPMQTFEASSELATPTIWP
jgi:hypothetical protein